MSSKEETVQAVQSSQCSSESSTRKPTNIFDKVVVNFYSVVCFVMSVLLMLIISAATVMRYVFEMDLYGYEEWVKIFAFWLYFMGAGYGTFAGTHITADLIQSYMKDSILKRFMTFFRAVITVGVTGIFTWYAYDFFMFGFLGPLGTGVAIPKTVAWKIPLWTAYLSIFLGYVSMMYYFSWELIRATQSLFRYSKEEGGSH